MIIGIGSDLVDINRIKKSIDRFGDRFTNRVFTPQERMRADNSTHRIAIYAKRFAAKEAAWKALGDGARLGIKWTELSVLNEENGKPKLVLTGAAEKILKELIPPGMKPRLDLSLSDEPPLAQALVVISADTNENELFRR
jgi:holo-[acyl-carrier protein] synthase|tara:strand:+ start:535 stop:954 length:420 start_codon:yes stop_codon:yes gene_type:complete